MRTFFRNNGLSITLVGLFLVFWAAQALTGWRVSVAEHPGTPESFAAYLGSGHFWGATGENWESEFLQMGAYVLLTSFLFQKGSAESKDPDAPPSPRSGAGFIRRNSLSLAFFLLFAISFVIHAEGSWREFNGERSLHSLPLVTLSGFLSGPEFWFQSFQNWQSEFLAVLSIVGLSIFLRQEGSPESKEIDTPNGANAP